MSRVNEKDIISFLQSKVTYLKAEISKAETALSFFSDEGKHKGRRGFKSALSNDIGQAGAGQTVSQKRRNSFKTLRPLTQLSIPEEFNDSLSKDKQIIYVLSKTPKLNAGEVAREIAGLLNTKSDTKLERTVLQRLSFLKQNGQIKAQKNGRTSYYNL